MVATKKCYDGCENNSQTTILYHIKIIYKKTKEEKKHSIVLKQKSEAALRKINTL